MFKLKIKAMNCKSCAHNIEDALKEHDSNIRLKADMDLKQLVIETVLTKEAVKKIVEDAGYPVDEI